VEKDALVADSNLTFPREFLDPLDESGKPHGSDHVLNFSEYHPRSIKKARQNQR
jgi:hypothetical protein